MASASSEDNNYAAMLRQAAFVFPNPRHADDEGLLAHGGELTSVMLLSAYKQGIFPWYREGEPILWWSPNPRLLLYPNKFIVRKSFKRVLRSGKFSVTFDRHFAEVITNCANVYREGQDETWITDDMKEAYIRLHKEGFAHSVEVHYEGELVGGLYGLALGRAFFGESMFSLRSDASKVAFKALSDVLGSKGYDFIDCQMKTDHMVRLGAEVVERDIYLDALEETLLKPLPGASWHTFTWDYKE